MKRFYFLLLLLTVRQVLPAQCTAPVVTASGPTLFCPGTSVTLSAPGSNVWAQKASASGVERYGAVAFSIGIKGYLGTGTDTGNVYKKDFWEYDPTTNAWTQRADFGGGERYIAAGFSIGSKGYIGTGADANNAFKKDFWEYDPNNNDWYQKADYGIPGSNATGFNIGSKGYIMASIFFYEYNPNTDTWVRKSNFPRGPRLNATGFSIGNKGYLGTGHNDVGYYNDFWEYNPATDAWVEKASISATGRSGATGFSMGSKGYIGLGHIVSANGDFNRSDFWEYNPAADTWVQKPDFGGGERNGAAGFSIGSKGYIGTGIRGLTGKKDFWEYDPGYTYAWSPGGQTTPSITVNTAGTYSVTVTNVAGCSATSAATTTTVATAPVVTASGPTGFCPGGSVVLSTPAVGNTWAPKADFGGQQRIYATVFSIGNKGYMGLGISNLNANTNKKDFWEYDPSTNTWAPKADFGGTARKDAVGFSVNDKGYIGTGDEGNGNYRKDFWEYNPAANTWIRKADLPGSARIRAVGFSMNNYGYILAGAFNVALKDVWRFNIYTNTWVQQADFSGPARFGPVGFSIGSKGYMGMGDNNGLQKDFWEYTPGDNYVWSPGGQITPFITATTAENYSVISTNRFGCMLMSVPVNVTIYSNQLFVDGSVAFSGNGSSWGRAFKTITEALTVASNTACIQEIRVAKGTYYPTSGTNRESSFRLPRNGFGLYGGYAPGGSATANPAANPTILSGNIGNLNDATDNSYHVLLLLATPGAIIDATTRIEGFTITGGYANNAGNATISGQPISNMDGGGMYCYGQESGNSCKPRIVNCTFYGNRANRRGGAIVNEGSIGGNSSPAIINCVFFDNNAGYISGFGGGAIYNNGDAGTSTPSITNCSFYGNNANLGTGGAVFNNGTGAIPVITNSIIYLNTNNSGISNVNNVNGATFNISYSIVQGGPLGNGNINANPLFVNPSAGNLQLQPCSPAINTGNAAALPADITTDVTGAARLFDAAVDMGSYEHQRLPTALAINADVATRQFLGLLAASLTTNCRLIATVEPNGANPVSGNVTAKVWVQTTQPSYNGQPYVKRHYEISPSTNASTATASITLYATQQEFDDFNAVSNNDLPTGPGNTAGIANLRIIKYNGQSSNGTGTPGTYAQPGTAINPDDNNILWNSSLSRWEITFNVTGFSGFFIGNANSAILPLTLLQFSGNPAGNHAQLTWQTANEVNVSHFELQRSTDGRVFTAIGQVQAKGTTAASASYDYTDKNLQEGLHYYRLRMVDKDGKESYSSIVSVKMNGQYSITLYPVPAKDNVWLSGSGESRIGKVATLLDAQGRVLQHIRIVQWPQPVDLRAMASGSYMIKIPGEASVQFIKN